MYGHMNGSPSPPKSKRTGLMQRLLKRFKKPQPQQSRLNTLPPELLGNIAKFLSNRNVRSLGQVQPRLNTQIVLRRRNERLRNLERRLARETGGRVGRRYREIVQNMRNVAAQHPVSIGWELHLMKTNRLLRNLRYSHPNAGGRGNIFKRMVRRRVTRRGRLVDRKLPEYYLLTPHGSLNRINIPPHFRTQRVAVNVQRNGNHLRIRN